MPAPCLELTSISCPQDSIHCEGGDLTIGRPGGDADRLIDHESLSRRHARLLHQSGDWSIRDLGSTNGTFVNWIKLDPESESPLHSGDVLALGSAEFMVQIEGEQATPPPPRRSATPSKIDHEDYRTRGTLLLRLGAEETLVREVSWQEFYDQYVPIIRGFARNAGCSVSAIDDIVHEVMTGFYRASERFEYEPGKGRFRGYLKVATLNVLRARHRREDRLVAVAFDESWLEDDSHAGDVLWTRAWRERMFERAIASVRERSRITEQSFDAFELCAVRGVPIAEAARQLGLSEAAVQKAKSRVTEAVREELDLIRFEEG